MDHGVELAALEPARSDRPAAPRRPVGAWRDCAICRRSETVVDDDVAAAGLVEAGDHVRTDEAGAAGDQTACPPRICLIIRLCPKRRRRRATWRGWNRARRSRLDSAAGAGLPRCLRGGTRRANQFTNIPDQAPRPAQPDPADPLSCGSATSCAATRWCGCCNARWPDRPVDVLTTTLCAPLLDYMPGVRKGIVVDLPRKRLAFGQHTALADAPAGRELRHRAGHAAHLEGGAGAVPGRHSRADRLRRRGPLRPAQRPALGRDASCRA